MGATLVAKRVTGTFMNEPYDRTDWLHRNHLNEAVVVDAYSFVPGGGSLTVGTYSQPFSSGGSDQFAGHKDDPETAQKYFGARYYNSGSARWTSPDTVLNRPKDPQSLNKYAYVRNDPVNLVDPDGRDPYNISVTVWAPKWNDPPPDPSLMGISGMFGDSSDQTRIVFDTFETGANGEAGGDVGPSQVLATLLADTAGLQSGLRDRAGVDSKKGKCYDFLVKVIAQLSGGRAPALAANFTVEKLVSNIMAAAKTPTTVASLGANARTVGNEIRIAADPNERMGNDYFSTLLHEGFHLLMSGRGRSQVSEEQLRNATSAADGTAFQGGSLSEFNKQMFGQNCGPGM
jgi:RHS repeat-associated protein